MGDEIFWGKHFVKYYNIGTNVEINSMNKGFDVSTPSGTVLFNYMPNKKKEKKFNLKFLSYVQHVCLQALEYQHLFCGKHCL